MAKKAAKKKQGVQGTVAKQVAPAKTRVGKAKPAVGRQASSRRTAPEPVVVLTHDQIAERAYLIWQANGGGSDRDPQNWAEAENQLRREHGVA